MPTNGAVQYVSLFIEHVAYFKITEEIMKRKLAALIMTTAMGLLCMVGLAGCGENEDNPPNTGGNEQTQEHTLVAHAAKDATCTEEGNTAYWECTDCGKYFSDEEATTEITLADTIVAATGHKTTAVAAKAATCTEAGNTAYYVCSACEKLFSDKDGENETALSAVTIVPNGHALEKTEGTSATCKDEGVITYWTCTVCHKLYSDAEGKTEIDSEDTVIPATDDHTYGEWLFDDEGHWKECSVCGDTTEKVEHTFDSQLVCEECGYEREAGDVTPPTTTEYTVTLLRNKENFTEEQYADITQLEAQWTDCETNQKFYSCFNSEGVASINLVEGHYSVTLATLPNGFTYNPNIYQAKDNHTDVFIDLYQLTPTHGTGEDPYNEVIVISKPGAYRLTLNDPSQEIWLRVVPTMTGNYSIESIVDVTANKINPVLYAYQGSIAYVHYASEKMIDGGGAESTFTKNFRWELQLHADEVGSVYFFALRSTNADHSAYPFAVDLIFDKDGEFIDGEDSLQDSNPSSFYQLIHKELPKTVEMTSTEYFQNIESNYLLPAQDCVFKNCIIKKYRFTLV